MLLAGTSFVTAVTLPALLQLLPHPVQKIPMSHFPSGLDPTSILLHRHCHLPIMRIEAKIQNPIDIVDQTCCADIVAFYCSVMVPSAFALDAG
jgi:hypothetical protein